MFEATATAHRLCDTPEAALTFIETRIRDKRRRVDALKDELEELARRPDADPVQVRAIEQMFRAMASELETEWTQLAAFREDFDIA